MVNIQGTGTVDRRGDTELRALEKLEFPATEPGKI